MNKTRGLWRGKRIDDGEWTEGYLIRPEFNPSTAYIGYLFATDDHDIDVMQVDPATLGECTGLRDKNGKLFFEGDIVEICGEDCFAVVGWCESTARFVLDFVCADEMSDFDSYWGYECEIIGNIHDTPELLKGAECNDVP